MAPLHDAPEVIVLKKGTSLDLEEMTEALVQMGYERESNQSVNILLKELEEYGIIFREEEKEYLGYNPAGGVGN